MRFLKKKKKDFLEYFSSLPYIILRPWALPFNGFHNEPKVYLFCIPGTLSLQLNISEKTPNITGIMTKLWELTVVSPAYSIHFKNTKCMGECDIIKEEEGK